MATDLSDRYNEGVVPAPNLPVDFPGLRTPIHRPTPEQVSTARHQLGRAFMILGLLVLLPLLLCLGFYGLGF